MQFYKWAFFTDIWFDHIKKLLPMDAEKLREYCLQKPSTEESFPFGEETLVFKVAGKMFLLMSLEANPLQFNVKCEPSVAEELRGKYSCVKPGYHMNKQHWNTIICENTVSEQVMLGWVDDSYRHVVGSLSIKIREKLKI